MAAHLTAPAPDTEIGDGAAALAAEAYLVVVDDPHRADGLAREALRRARRARDPATVSAACRALGMAALELDRADTAVAHLEAAVRAGRRAGPQLEANARTSLALALVNGGAGRRALRHADLAVGLIGVPERGAVHLGRALVRERLGRLDGALEDYREALAAFQRVGDRNCEARVLCNRGVLQTYRGALGAAEADLRRAERLCRDLNLDLMAASVHQNLGFVAAQRGNVVTALECYDRVQGTFALLGGTRYAVLELDRCGLMLVTGLLPEARTSADRAVQALERTGMGAELAEARLLSAEVSLSEREWPRAAAVADQARRAFVAQRRSNWAALAGFAAVRATWNSEGASTALLERSRRIARELER
ncbi:MAG: tetratricopeptide repeat protein, partial [Actinomycetota bacterium]|nr:tetratricopeptide repeat protein [Actinomycetota bacterium]